MESTAIAQQPLEHLEHLICQGAANLTSAECEWLAAVAEFDRREGWAEWACASCAAWLSWQVGLDIRAAREKVRVARALEEFPAIRAAMAHGHLPYSKVRAITRIATTATQVALVDLALAGTTNQVERIVAAFRRSQEASLDAERSQRERHGLTSRTEQDGSVTITVRLGTVDAAAVLSAVEARVAPARDETGVVVPLAVRRADALVEAVCALAPAGGGELVHLHVDADVLAAEANRTAADSSPGGDDPPDDDPPDDDPPGDDDEGSGQCHVEAFGDSLDGPRPVSAAEAFRAVCNQPIIGVVHRADGTVDTTSRGRMVSGARRKQVELRDRSCRVPGCERRGNPEIHHIRHRLHGGDHELPNLVLLCRFHHHLVHQPGWDLTRAADGTMELRSPNGRRIKAAVDPLLGDVASVDGCQRTADDGRCQWQGDPLDLGLITELLHHLADRPGGDAPQGAPDQHTDDPPADPPAA